MGAFATMTSKGQLTIPKDVRDELNLTTGTRFFISVRDGQVVAHPKNKRIADLAGILGTPPKGGGATLEDFDNAVGKALSDDDERIARQYEVHPKSK